MARNKATQFFYQLTTTHLRFLAVNDGRKCVHRVAVKKNIYLNQIRITITAQLVVKRSITTSGGFQSIKIVIDNFAQRQRIVNHNTTFVKISHVFIFTAFFLAQFHYSANIIFRYDDGCVYERFFYVVNNGRIREVRRIIYHFHITISTEHFVNYVRSSGDKGQTIFTFQAFFDNVHMEQA